MPDHLGKWLAATSDELGIDQTQIVRYALSQLKAELQLTKQMRANLSTQGQSLEQVRQMDIKTAPRTSPDSISKHLEALLAGVS
jgi:uncharacterized protein with von Willebrand factor type A (vWA) domain